MKLAKRGKEKSPAPLAKVPAPFWPMRQLQAEIDRLFEEPFGSWLTPNGPVFDVWSPVVDVLDRKESFVVKAEIPGMKKEEFEVYMTGDNLNIAGERKVESEEKTAETYHAERYFGRFHRSIPLPAAVDSSKIEAHYKDGILTITCPKTEAAKRKAIEIKGD